jgi:hypothetical protein
MARGSLGVIAASDEVTAGVAVVGVCGTLAGIVITHYLTKNREKDQASRDAARAAQTAARLLQGELAWAETRAETALRNGRYWSEEYALRDTAWQKHQEVIAEAMSSPEEWSAVRDGFRSLQTLELQARTRRERTGKKMPPFNDFAREQTGFALVRIRAASEALQPVAKALQRESLADERAGPIDPT